MNAGRLATLVVSALLCATTAAPALATPDPTTGTRNQGATVVVTPTSAVSAETDGFHWADAAIGAAIGLGAAALGGLTVRRLRPRHEEQPLASV